MGMYDNIEFEMKCPLCKTYLNGFQSKDGDCMLDTLPVTAVEEFYDSCHNCNLWILFSVSQRVVNGITCLVVIPEYMDMQAVNAGLLEQWTVPEWRRKKDEEEALRREGRGHNRRYTDVKI